MHRLILLMVILLLASACSARAESQGVVEDPLPVSGVPAADLAAPDDGETAPFLEDGDSRLARRHLVTDARAGEQRDPVAGTAELPERPSRIVARPWDVEKLMRHDPALAEAVDSIGGDIFDQADRSRYLRVYLDGTFEWIRLARDRPVHWRIAREIARNNPELWWALDSLSDYGGGNHAIHVYTDGSWEFYWIIREKRQRERSPGSDTLCGPTECDP
jgi:hypothetical protein